MYIYCDCRNKNGELDTKKADWGKSGMRVTKVNKEGVCHYCGHYPFYSIEPIAPNGKTRPKTAVNLNRTELKYLRS